MCVESNGASFMNHKAIFMHSGRYIRCSENTHFLYVSKQILCARNYSSRSKYINIV